MNVDNKRVTCSKHEIGDISCEDCKQTLKDFCKEQNIYLCGDKI
jgi:cytidine deaminase